MAGAILLVSISMTIVWPLTRKGHWTAWVVSLSILAFFVGVGLMFVPTVMDLLIFFKTIPIGVRILFALPWIIGLLALIILVFLIRMCKEDNTPWWARTYYILVLLSAFATVWLANSWNLML